MATRAAIAIADGDQLRGVYLHWDGYLSWAGKILQENWTRRGTVNQLIDQGDISSLGPSIGIKHDFDGARPREECTFYVRDRGEPMENCAPKTWATAEHFVEDMSAAGCEFFYIFGWDDRWWVTCAYGPLSRTWTTLEESFQKVRDEIG